MDTTFFAGEHRTALRATLRDQLKMRDAGNDARVYGVRGHSGFHIVVWGETHGCSGVGDGPSSARDFCWHGVVDSLVLCIAAGDADDPERKLLLRVTGAVTMVKDEGEFGGALGSGSCQYVPVKGSSRGKSAARCYPVAENFDTDRLACLEVP